MAAPRGHHGAGRLINKVADVLRRRSKFRSSHQCGRMTRPASRSAGRRPCPDWAKGVEGGHRRLVADQELYRLVHALQVVAVEAKDEAGVDADAMLGKEPKDLGEVLALVATLVHALEGFWPQALEADEGQEAAAVAQEFDHPWTAVGDGIQLADEADLQGLDGIATRSLV